MSVKSCLINKIISVSIALVRLSWYTVRAQLQAIIILNHSVWFAWNLLKRIAFSNSIFSFFQHLQLKYTNIWELKKFQKANFMPEQFEKGIIFACFVTIRPFLNLISRTIFVLNISKFQNQLIAIPKTTCSPMFFIIEINEN